MTGNQTEHQYRLSVEWTGNQGSGTSNYRAFGRDHVVRAEGKPEIVGSSDPSFRGDPGRWNSEELLVASVSQCHMLWYLHLAATAGVVVTSYRDDPIGTMVEDADGGGGGQFSGITLRPTVTVAFESMCDRAEQLHDDVGAKCFVARSLNFPIRHQPRVTADRAS